MTSTRNHREFGTGHFLREQPVAKMLGQVYHIVPGQMPCDVLVVIDCHKFVGDFWSELRVVNRCELWCGFYRVISRNPLFYLVLEIWLPLKFFHFILCSFLPAINVQTISEKDDELEKFLRIKIWVQDLGILSQIQMNATTRCTSTTGIIPACAQNARLCGKMTRKTRLQNELPCRNCLSDYRH